MICGYCFLELWFAASAFEVILEGAVPVDSAVAEDLAGTVIEPGCKLSIFEVRILLVDRRLTIGIVDLT